MKKKIFLIVTFALIFTFVLSGCSIIQNFLPTGKAGSTSSNVLFEDDFSKTSSGWDQTTSESGTTDYKDGTYQILVNQTQYDLWANPGKSFTDVSTEVDAVMIGGPVDNDFGIICRYKDTSNYYFGIISSDGYYAIGYVKDGKQDIFADQLEFSDAIKQGTESNRIRFDCVGSTLTLYANGTQLTQVTDSTLTSGDVGLMAGTFDTAGTNVSFDNFVVKKP
ncbi:MAG: DUF2167 domain-containing protein [Veillonellaceae bacterium]|nr:DUF2167 domain-containing protein [Veillonellaceae bacterium]